MAMIVSMGAAVCRIVHVDDALVNFWSMSIYIGRKFFPFSWNRLMHSDNDWDRVAESTRTVLVSI